MEDFYRDQFLGPQLGTYYGYPVYAPDKDAFYQATTPEQFRSFSGNLHNVSETWTQNVNFQVVNANLFEMPAGSGRHGRGGPGRQPVLGQPGRSAHHQQRILRAQWHQRRAASATTRRSASSSRVPLLKDADRRRRRALRRLPERRRRLRLQADLQARPGIPAERAPAVPRQLRDRVPRAGHGIHLHRRQRFLQQRRPITTSARVDPANCTLVHRRVGRRQPGRRTRT